MRWSQMNSAQQAFLLAGAKFKKDVIKNNKFVRQGDPMNAYAMIIVSAKALDRDHEREHGRASMLAARAKLDEETQRAITTYYDPGKAWKGSNETNRKRAGAMPQNFYRAAGLNL
jgi:hypothetical protein